MITYDNGSYNEQRFLFLVEKIPNWELYLTDKQLECAKLYISGMSVTMIEDKLNLGRSTAYSRLFGNSDKTGIKSKGAMGKLEEIYTKLEKMGHFKEKEIKDKQKYANKAILSDKTLQKVKELLTIVSDLEDYQQYLTESQNEKLYKFLQTKSFKECAKYFDIAEITFKQTILGRDDDSGILGKLRKEYDKSHINDWNSL
jgi:hypothetical protein